MTDDDVTADVTEPESPRRGVIIAFLVAGAVLVGASIFANKVQKTPAPVVPAITVGSATDTVTNPATVRFVTNASLRLEKQMWSAGDLHPHAYVDSVMLMPMGADIEHISSDTFALHLPSMNPGPHTVRVFWANGSHLPMGNPASINLLVR